ncbi:MAG TPA: sigma-70 family RNA polymerase sigma factor [Polyangiaceae bacterium]|nr:sigma-70 family RNA polymerase sigma factor [Polyangiaceae bacterium]
MDSESEESLMAAYGAGDRRAFARLFVRVAPKLHRFFARAFRDEAAADELMQTTFLKLHHARHSYRPEMPFAPWLFTIAVHVRRDEWRRRFRLPETAGEEAIALADQKAAVERADDHARHEDRASAVRAAVAALPEVQRVVLQLHQYEGMSYPEIAVAIGSTPGAIRQQAFRAYEALRKNLAPLLAERATAGRLD